MPGPTGLENVWAYDVWTGLAAADASMPPPPYQVRFDDGDLSVGFELDAEAVRPLVPVGLRLPTPATGGIVVYAASTGWGITPYTGAFAYVDIDGIDAPDGTRGRLKLAGFYSGVTATKAYSALSRHCGPGISHKEFDGDLVTATGGPRDEEHFRVVARRRGGPGRPMAGTRYYLGDDGQGRLTWAAMAYTFTALEAEPVEVVVRAPPGSPLAAFRPTRLSWAILLKDKVATLGVPTTGRPVVGRHEPELSALTALLGRIHRPAVVISPDCRVLYRNEAATGILDDGIAIEGDSFAPSAAKDKPALDDLVASALSGSTSQTVAFARPSGRKPLLVQAARLAAPQAGPDRGSYLVLLLLTDPDAIASGDTLQALQLLGLTPAESRAAALVGSGLTAREAAELLGNSEGTVRVTLNRVFHKLDIGKQSELARIVNRLDPLFA